MKRLALATLGFLAAALPGGASGIGPFSDLLVFGDSYSDPGNAAFLTGGLIPNPLYYPNGQFTNGDVWATQVGADFSSGTNFAVGGAKAVTDMDASPDLFAQISAFQSAPLSLGSTPLATIFIGGNDLRQATTPAEAATIALNAVSAIGTGINTLIGAGIREFAVFGLPDLGRLPEVVGTVFSSAATLATIEYNATLRTMLAGVPDTATVRYVDTFGVFETIFADPTAFGISNTTDGCLLVELDGTACRGDLGYFFQDELHATEPVHTALAEAFVNTVAPIPLPAAGVLLLAGLGGLALVGRRRITKG